MEKKAYDMMDVALLTPGMLLFFLMYSNAFSLVYFKAGPRVDFSEPDMKSKPALPSLEVDFMILTPRGCAVISAAMKTDADFHIALISMFVDALSRAGYDKDKVRAAFIKCEMLSLTMPNADYENLF